MIIYVCLDILPTKHPTVVSPVNHPIPTFLHSVMTSLHPLSPELSHIDYAYKDNHPIPTFVPLS